MSGLPTETLDTRPLAPADRWPFWQAMTGRVSTPLSFHSEHADDFQGDARTIALGPVGMVLFRYQSLTCWRTPQLIRQTDPEIYQIGLVLAGDTAVSARRRNTAVAAGDLTFIDWGRPHEVRHMGGQDGRFPAASITASIPRSLLPLDEDRVDRLSGIRISGTEGTGALLAQHLHRINRHPEQFHPAEAPYLADVTVSLVASMLARQLDSESSLPAEQRQQVTLTRIREFVDRHLGDRSLTPRAVADAHHVSLRTLHRLFAESEDTIAGHIRRRRLDRCRRDLADPLLAAQPVGVIARRWGFTDQAHFSRAFRAAYGMSPRAWRDGHRR
ncbi:helix-turn-helix domain-containing protein [Micromonospora sp. NPDC050686]|uniref:AraC-like ligand-binding domain-containing protein n=1 Tax=Micromonospora sp. NPDC050686 TaxID=3154631 RepID=UPI0033C3785B